MNRDVLITVSPERPRPLIGPAAWTDEAIRAHRNNDITDVRVAAMAWSRFASRMSGYDANRDRVAMLIGDVTRREEVSPMTTSSIPGAPSSSRSRD